MKTLQGNEKIARILKWEEKPVYNDVPNATKRWYPDKNYDFYPTLVTSSGLKFDSSWEWLMLAHDRINSLKFEKIDYDGFWFINAEFVINIFDNSCVIILKSQSISKTIIRQSGSNKKDALWKAIVFFIDEFQNVFKFEKTEPNSITDLKKWLENRISKTETERDNLQDSYGNFPERTAKSGKITAYKEMLEQLSKLEGE